MLVFTAVAGAQTLWEQLPTVIESVMRTHDALLRGLLARHGGYEVKAKTDGDGLMVAFSDVASAARWCAACQEGLQNAAWPDALLERPGATPGLRGLAVSMGAHVDDPLLVVNPITGRMDYHGAGVNRAARLCQAAHGGQVLISGQLRDELLAAGVVELQMSDLGAHRLRGLEGTETLVDLRPLSLASRSFPPPTAMDPARTNLPENPTPFVGREAELRALARLVAEGARLVTLLGPPGVGKTRLALNFGSRWMEGTSEQGGGVWYCDLSHAASINGVLAAVAEAIGVPLISAQTADASAAQLGRALGSRGQILLVLDSFELAAEHAPATLGRWLQLAPEAHFLVTSRERLRLEGELAHELGPMVEEDAIELFVERARAVRPTLALGDGDDGVLRALVNRLDRLPMAVELAAAQVDNWTPRNLLEQVTRRLDLPSAAGRGLGGGALRAALDLSWNLLDEVEQDALASCSVFHGGFDMEAVEAVLDLSHHDGSPWPPDALDALRDRSLLRVEEPPGLPGELRFSLYGIVREYAADRLEQSRRASETEARHRAWYVPLCEADAAGLEGPDGARHLARLALEAENLEAAYLTAMRLPRDPVLGVRALLALEKLFAIRGPQEAHLVVLDRAVVASAEAPSALRVGALLARAEAYVRRSQLAEAQADLSAARFWLGQAADRRLTVRCDLLEARVAALDGRSGSGPLVAALDGARELGDAELLGHALVADGLGRLARGDLHAAAHTLDEALNIFRARGLRLAESATMARLGAVQLMLSRFDLAEPLLRQAASIAEETGHNYTLMSVAANLGVLYLDTGRWGAAEAALTRTRELARRAGSLREEATALALMGLLLLERDEIRAGEAHANGALSLARDGSDQRCEGLAQESLAIIAQHRGHLQRAVQLHEDALTLLLRAGHRVAAAQAGAGLATALASVGRHEEAAARLAEAEELAAELSSATVSALLAVSRGRLAAEEARRARAAGDEARANALIMMAREAHGSALVPSLTEGDEGRMLPAAVARSVDVRLAAGMLERTLQELSG